jgi:carboxymethylenebutenolidase
MAQRLTAQDFDQELLILFDAYVHGNLDRRGFLNQAQKYAKAGVTAASLLAALSPDFAAGQQVRPDATRHRAMTRPPPSWRGSARWLSSGCIWARITRAAEPRCRVLWHHTGDDHL